MDTKTPTDGPRSDGTRSSSIRRWALRGASAGCLLGATENVAALLSGEGLPFGYLFVVLSVGSGLGGVVGAAIAAGRARSGWGSEIPTSEALVWLTAGLILVWAADKSITAALFRGLPFWLGPLALVFTVGGGTLLLGRSLSRLLAMIDGWIAYSSTAEASPPLSR